MIQKKGIFLCHQTLNIYYLEHRTWWFDTKILIKTFINIVFGKKF